MKKDDDNFKNNSNNDEANLSRLKNMLEGLKNNPQEKKPEILGMIRNNRPGRAAEYMQKLRNGEFDPGEYEHNYKQHPFYLQGLKDGRRQAEECADMRFDEVFDHLIDTIHLLRK